MRANLTEIKNSMSQMQAKLEALTARVAEAEERVSELEDGLIDHGFQDFDIDGHPVVRRACVPNSIKKGEHFNVYHGESSKSGAVWTGTLGDSLRKFALI